MGVNFCFVKKLRVLKFLNDERGQGTVEYILLLSLTAGVALYFGRTLIDTIDRGILKFGAQLDKDLKSGRAPASVWAN